MRLTDCEVLLSDCMFSAVAGIVVLVFMITMAVSAVLAGWQIWKVSEELMND